jgi:hypothetical protein
VTKQKALRPDGEPSGTNYGAIGNSSDNDDQIGREGFEPSRGCPQRILSLLDWLSQGTTIYGTFLVENYYI